MSFMKGTIKMQENILTRIINECDKIVSAYSIEQKVGKATNIKMIRLDWSSFNSSIMFDNPTISNLTDVPNMYKNLGISKGEVKTFQFISYNNKTINDVMNCFQRAKENNICGEYNKSSIFARFKGNKSKYRQYGRNDIVILIEKFIYDNETKSHSYSRNTGYIENYKCQHHFYVVPNTSHMSNEMFLEQMKKSFILNMGL